MGNVPSNGLRGYWDFEEGSGTIAYDGSGYGNNGMVSAAWAAGKKGGGVDFQGGNRAVDCGNDQSVIITGSITVALWVFPRANNLAQTFMASGQKYTLWVQLNNRVRFADALGHWVDTPGGVLQLNRWNHVVGQFSGAWGNTVNQNNAKVYVNTVSRGAYYSGAWTPNAAALNPLIIGSPPFTGKIDEAYLYNRALTLTEIRGLHSDTLAPVREHFAGDRANGFDVNVYPNPFSTSVEIRLNSSTVPQFHSSTVNQEIKIFDINGRLVSNLANCGTVELQHCGTSYRWHAQDQPNGVYMVRVKTDNAIMTRKFVLQK
jgi:hypothetical protein